jgi:Zn-finger nucleic acid-binding protein
LKLRFPRGTEPLKRRQHGTGRARRSRVKVPGLSPRKCPHHALPLTTETYAANIEVDVCGQCHGMWLDKGELEAIEEASQHDYREQLREIRSQGEDSAHVSEQLAAPSIRCPQCRGEMEKREYGYCSQIVIDTCNEGCGVWLDAGEIQALEIFFEQSQRAASDVIPLSWRLWASLQDLFRERKTRPH